MKKKNGSVSRKLIEVLKKNNIEVGRKVNDKNAYLTHLIQNNNGWSDEFVQWAEDKYDNEQDNITRDDGGLPNLFPVDYTGVPFKPVKPGEEDFTFIDLFAGIGGFRIAMQEEGGRCVFSSEWDINSQRTYFANFGEIPFGDITKAEVKAQIPEKFDVLCGGFPCQPFSLAGVSKKNSLGKKHGFLDEAQGTLFYDIAEILERHRPKAFVLENVKNLKSHDKKKTYRVIKDVLEKLNYKVFDQIIDAKYYVPQHRERIFIVGFNLDYYSASIDFDFPIPPKEIKAVKDILEESPDPKYTLTDHLWTYLQNYAKKHALKGNGFGFGLVDLNSYTRTLSARYHKDGSEILIPQGKDKNPRRLTSGECKALMGYPATFKIENIGVSQTQIYRQFGNSVAVPVVKAIAKKLKKFL
jgi:DNA (cytosine-5)-methyltransferase 1